MPAIDFSQVKGLEPIDEGVYEATIVDAKEGISKKGNPKIDLRWQVDVDGRDRIVFDTLTFSPESMWRVKLTLQALGFASDFSGDVEPEDLIGASARITVAIDRGRKDPATGEEYPDRNTVKKVQPLADMSLDDFIS